MKCPATLVGEDEKSKSFKSTLKFEGKGYPIPATGLTFAYRQIDNGTLEGALKKDGKIQRMSTNVISEDGRVRIRRKHVLEDHPHRC